MAAGEVKPLRWMSQTIYPGVMGIEIDQAEVERAIHALAEMRGQSPTDLIGEVMLRELSEELERRKLPPERQAWLEDVRRMRAYVRTLPVLDNRSPDEMLYDEHGLPK